ncbi:MAG: type II secretion system protein GspD [Planctomycetota bacterium]|jgi:type IV pilus assembly protein PilQ
MYHNRKSSRKIKRKADLFVWCFILAMLAASAVGDVGQAPAEVETEELISSSDVETNAGDDNLMDKTIQSITFKKDIGIKDALHFLGAKYQKNIVPSVEVNGLITVTSLYDVTFEDAMDAILGGKYEYEEKANLIEVYPKGDESRMKYKVFSLHYISAAEAQKLIEPVLSGKGVVGVTTAADTGVPTGESISAPKGGGDTMSLRDTIVVYDYAENIKRAKELIASVDVRPQQVLIEATILSATLTEDTQFGIDWQTLKGTPVTSLTDISQGDPDYFKSDGLQLGGATSLSGGLTVGLALGDIASFIRAVEQVSDVTILANPKILAVNKQLGQVYIGDKIGYNSQTTVSEGGTSTSQVNFLDTGTKLSFRPYISVDGYIRLDIHAKNSKETSGEVISETSTELVSNIMVKDGQTIVIGGLFQDTVETKKSQIPILGDLPFVGSAFKGTSDQLLRKEVMVLLTPHIIEEPSEAGGQARIDDVRRKRTGAKEQLQWISRARLAEDYYVNAVEHYLDGYNEAALQKVNKALVLRPTYIEAISLKEKIVLETAPEDAAMMERIMLDVIEREETDKWLRR